MAKMIGFAAIDFDHVLGHRALHRQAIEHIGALERLGQRPLRRLDRIGRFPLVHAVRAALVDHPLGVAEDQVLRPKADRAQQFQAGDAGRARAVADDLGVFDLAPGQVERVEQARSGDDRGAVLVVMEHRDIEQFAQPLLDDEALGRLDVLEVDAAPAFAEQLHAIDDLVGVLGVHLEVDGIDVGKALEQDRLALHHGLRRERAAVAEA